MRGLSDTKLPGGIHYSWVIVAILALVQMVGQSIGMAAGIMVAPLNDPDGAFGWGMATIGAALGLYYLTGAIFAPISGWLGDRYGARRTMLAGGLLYGSSMLLLGIISQAWHFFIVFSFMLAITQSISMVPLIAAVNGWELEYSGPLAEQALHSWRHSWASCWSMRAGRAPSGPSAL